MHQTIFKMCLLFALIKLLIADMFLSLNLHYSIVSILDNDITYILIRRYFNDIDIFDVSSRKVRLRLVCKYYKYNFNI